MKLVFEHEDLLCLVLNSTHMGNFHPFEVVVVDNITDNGLSSNYFIAYQINSQLVTIKW